MNKNIYSRTQNSTDTRIPAAVRDEAFEMTAGKIPFDLTNDYMFRAVLQSSNKVLRGLICSLLHLSERKVVSVEITNPVILGETVTDKEFRLDINVVLNNHALIWMLNPLYISDSSTIRCLRNSRSSMRPIN